MKHENMLISKDFPIKDTMERLNETAEKTLYIISEGTILVGAITDGDIRRALLKGYNLDDSIESVMNKNPKFLYKNNYALELKTRQMMLDFVIQSIPIVTGDKKIVDIVLWEDVFKKDYKYNYPIKDNKVFILAGGMGTRLEPFTRILPKPLVPIGNQPILEKIMDKFNEYGFKKFILSLNYKAEMIKLYFKDTEINQKYENIEFLVENKPLGTIGSLYLEKNNLKETFFIANSDIILEENLEKIFTYHKHNKNVLTIVGCVKDSIIPYGVLETDDTGNLKKMIEKPKLKHVINTGIYVAEPEIINYIEEDTKTDINELIERLMKDNKKVNVYPIIETQWFDIGQWEEFQKTKAYFENR